jgi:hypothetical protein
MDSQTCTGLKTFTVTKEESESPGEMALPEFLSLPLVNLLSEPLNERVHKGPDVIDERRDSKINPRLIYQA